MNYRKCFVVLWISYEYFWTQIVNVTAHATQIPYINKLQLCKVALIQLGIIKGYFRLCEVVNILVHKIYDAMDNS